MELLYNNKSGFSLVLIRRIWFSHVSKDFTRKDTFSLKTLNRYDKYIRDELKRWRIIKWYACIVFN